MSGQRINAGRLRNAELWTEEFLENPDLPGVVVWVALALLGFILLSWLLEVAISSPLPSALLLLFLVVWLVQGLPTEVAAQNTFRERLAFTVPLWIARTFLAVFAFGFYGALIALDTIQAVILAAVVCLVVGPIIWFALLQIRHAGKLALQESMSADRVSIVILVVASQVFLWSIYLLGVFEAPNAIAILALTALVAGWQFGGNMIISRQFRVSRAGTTSQGNPTSSKSNRPLSQAHAGPPDPDKDGVEIFFRCLWFAYGVSMMILKEQERMDAETGMRYLLQSGMVDADTYRGVLQESIAYAAACAHDELRWDLERKYGWSDHIYALMVEYEYHIGRALDEIFDYQADEEEVFGKMVSEYCDMGQNEAFERFWETHEREGQGIQRLLQAEQDLDVAGVHTGVSSIYSHHHNYVFRMSRIVKVSNAIRLLRKARSIRAMTMAAYKPAFVDLPLENVKASITTLMQEGEIPLRNPGWS